MNSIAVALHSAGVKLPPLKKRAWLWLNDHQGKTSKQVAAAIGEKHSNVATALGNLVKRRMVTSTKQPHPFRNISELHYETCVKRYELLPVHKKAKAPSVVSAPPAPAHAYIPTPAFNIIPAPKVFNLDDLTVREARDLYTQLHNMFGDKK